MGWFTYVNIELNGEIEDFEEEKAIVDLERRGVIIEAIDYMANQYEDRNKMFVSIKYGAEGDIMDVIEYLKSDYDADVKRVEIEATNEKEYPDWKYF